jgi:hypothetical protein
MSFGVWCPEQKTWLETLLGQTQEFPNIVEAGAQAKTLNEIAKKTSVGNTYVVRTIGPRGRPIE